MLKLEVIPSASPQLVAPQPVALPPIERTEQDGSVVAPEFDLVDEPLPTCITRPVLSILFFFGSEDATLFLYTYESTFRIELAAPCSEHVR